MIEYTCDWSLSDVSIWCYGAEIATHDDLDCTLVLDDECRLIAVRFLIDRVTGKAVEIDNRCLTQPAYIDPNAQSVWRSALVSVGKKADVIRDKAGIPYHPTLTDEYVPIYGVTNGRGRVIA